MRRSKLIRICGLGLCAVTAAAVLINGNTGVKASGLAKRSGLAGVSLCMDEAFGQSDNKTANNASTGASVLAIDEAISTALAGMDKANNVTAFSLEIESEGVPAAPAEDIAPEEKTEETTQENKSEETDTAENKTDDDDEGSEGNKTKDEMESTEEEVKSKYENIGISIADPYVNIRGKANTESKIIGKLYKGSKCDILKTVGDWVKIESGNAKGYIKAEFLARGFDAEELIDVYGTKFAVVTTETLNVRFEPNTDSRIATLVPYGEKLLVTKKDGDWYEVSLNDGAVTGWVSAEFVKVKISWKHAITIKEEMEEAARKAAAEEALARQQAAYAANSSGQTSSSTTRKKITVADSGNYSATGVNIANFALKFVGNPYVWGGTSLTNGADCSGFVQSVYRNFGIGLSRDSRSQSGNGSSVSLNALQPGDLVFYAPNGYRISHVAIYIGGGKVVHASSPQTGIMVSSVYHLTPYCARRIVN